MKKVWLMLAVLVCIFASCSDGGSDNPVDPTPKPEEVKTEITIDSGIVSNGLSFGATEGEQSVSFSVNANWTLSVASTTSGTTWCKASATSGSKGTANVKFTVSENTDYEDRSVSVTIKAGTVSKTFTITQKGADALLVTTAKYEVPQEGGQIEVEVKANIDYLIEISEDANSWITESKSKSRAMKTTIHKFEIALNEEAEKREGEITFKSGDKVEVVNVYQAGGTILLLSQNEYTVSDAGDTISVDIKSNVEYGVQLPDVDWITDEASTRGMSSHTLKYIIAANEEYDTRSAEVIFYDKNSDLKDTLKVVQTQKDAIISAQSEYIVESSASHLDFTIKTNVNYKVEISVDWIKQTSESRALKEEKLSFSIEENTLDEAREGIITISSENVSQTIKVVQKGKFYLTFDNEVFEVMEGKTLELSYSTNFTDSILWKSLDANILTVSNKGTVTGINKGETTVIVSSEDGTLSDSCKVIVKSITDYIDFKSGMSSIQIGGYGITSISSTIINSSEYDIVLVSFAIYNSETGELYSQTTDPSLLGTLKAGESKSLGIDNFSESFTPKYVWEFIFEGARYRNNEKVAGSGTDSTGATGEDMPWQ